MNHIDRFYVVFELLSDEDYNKLLECHRCGERNNNWIDRFPSKENRNATHFSFVTARCLSCGAFISLAKNLERKEKSGSIVITVKS